MFASFNTVSGRDVDRRNTIIANRRCTQRGDRITTHPDRPRCPCKMGVFIEGNTRTTTGTAATCATATRSRGAGKAEGHCKFVATSQVCILLKLLAVVGCQYCLIHLNAWRVPIRDESVTLADQWLRQQCPDFILISSTAR